MNRTLAALVLAVGCAAVGRSAAEPATPRPATPFECMDACLRAGVRLDVGCYNHCTRDMASVQGGGGA